MLLQTNRTKFRQKLLSSQQRNVIDEIPPCLKPFLGMIIASPTKHWNGRIMMPPLLPHHTQMYSFECNDGEFCPCFGVISHICNFLHRDTIWGSISPHYVFRISTQMYIFQTTFKNLKTVQHFEKFEACVKNVLYHHKCVLFLYPKIVPAKISIICK